MPAQDLATDSPSPASDSGSVAGPPSPVDEHYRPSLDGLRTVAVVLVVAFHSGLGVLSGGFVGVDIFFVLSGFLVTGILLRDLERRGRIQWQRFYSRRVRRILPAAVVVLVVSASVYAAIATPAERIDAFDGFRAAFLYVANRHFIQQSTDYFAANVNTNPVLHFWSLAVEEQFYLLWPLLLGLLYVVSARAGRHRWSVLRAAVLVAAGASVVAAWHIGATNLSRAYYGTDTRAYQLLAGALLALTPQLSKLGPRARRVAPGVALVALIGTIFVATSAIDVSAITRGVVIAVLAPVLIISLENATGGIARSWLSSGPMVFLGRVSYGVYLWHWPLIVILAHQYSISPVPLFLIVLPSSIALATISFRILEHPLRAARALDRYRVPVIVIGFSASILLGLLVMPLVLDSGNTSIASATGGSGPTLLDWRVAKNDIPKFPDCLHKPVDQCIVVHGSGKRVVLIGDSVARMWIPAFTEIARENSWTLAIASYPGCPWQKDLQYAGSQIVLDQCTSHRDDWYARVVPDFHPDIVVLAQHSYDDPQSPNRFIYNGGHVLTGGDSAFESTLISASKASLDRLQAPGREVVFVEPVPSPPRLFDPLSCLSTGKKPAKCTYKATSGATTLEMFFRDQAKRDDALKTIDLDQFVCPGKRTCQPVLHNIIVWRDTAHITATYARWLVPDILGKLRAQHIG